MAKVSGIGASTISDAERLGAKADCKATFQHAEAPDPADDPEYASGVRVRQTPFLR
jgi:hypothetical protein